MADNNFRSYRSRDPFPPDDARAPARRQNDDPLADLARLIGQNDPQNYATNDFDRHAGHGHAPALDHHYAESNELAPEPSDGRYEDDERYDQRYDERYDPPPQQQVADPYATRLDATRLDATRLAASAAPDLDYEHHRRPSPNGARDDARGYAVAPQRYRDEQDAPPASGRELQGFRPPSRGDRYADDRYEYDDQEHDGADDQAYADPAYANPAYDNSYTDPSYTDPSYTNPSYANPSYTTEDYEEEAPSGRRRSGFVVVTAVLSLAVLGTAGAFAYRAMFGGSMLPSLPPIIKADNGPNKIVPNAGHAQGDSSDQANANTGSAGEKLVSRQEQPVDVSAPVSAAPRVVSTIPIFPDPTPSAAAMSALSAGAMASIAPGTMASASPMPPAAAPAAPVAMPPASVPAASSGPRKIHTVAIRTDDGGNTDATASATPQPPATQPARTTAPRPVAAGAPRYAPQVEGNAPLAIVPSQGGVPAQPHTRIAMAQPTALTPSAPSAAAAGGGYAVQITSQRSEAEAQAAFRALRTKYPTQLGGHQPIIQRADLGSKGVYYRALVGPFASAEQAAGLCSNLKAAGGNCIVERN